MSFTAEVKDDIARVEAVCPTCDLAELSALIRVCGTLSWRGPGRYSIRIATETGAVARTLIKLSHKVFDLETELTVRRSNLHKSRNYLIVIPEQPGLEEALLRMGILRQGRGVVSGIAPGLVRRECCRRAYLRGAFMAGGFIADPRGDFHLEIAVTGEDLAGDLVRLTASLGLTARVNSRRGSFAIYLKSFDDVVAMLVALGAQREAIAVENVRVVKSVKNDVNRRVNAEIANQARSTGAAADQLVLIDEAERLVGLGSLPPALREFCEMRRAYPELSLRDLGRAYDKPVSKSALYHRVLRLRETVDQASRTVGPNP
jgi:DNA-binding protein WhiA